MSEILVPDVSRWQGVIDWDQIKANYPAVIIKATGSDGGLYTDGRFTINRDAARARNIPRWFYHYKGDGVSARDQAQYMLNAIGLQAGEGIVLDDENEGKVNPEFNAEFSDAIRDLSGGLVNVAYANQARFQGVDLGPLNDRNVRAWVAKYGINDGTRIGGGNPPTDLGIQIVAWQYTSAARIPGITANTVDMSVFYGSVEDFLAYGAKGDLPAVQAPSESAPVATGNGTYTVRAGDSLSAIGSRLGVSWQSIAATNGIVAPYTIFPGQILKVYGGTASQPATVEGGTYMVVSGDTLSGIGVKTGYSWSDIASLNGIGSPYTIFPGQTLKLPGQTVHESAASVPTYTVVSGDYLSGIGNRTGVNWTTIAQLNGISEPYTIYPGQVLKLA